MHPLRGCRGGPANHGSMEGGREGRGEIEQGDRRGLAAGSSTAMAAGNGRAVGGSGE
jgi:hypothetical protein